VSDAREVELARLEFASGGPVPSRARGPDVAVLGGLYLVQGIVWGFGGLLLLPRLAAAGVPLEQQAGIVALAGVPWVFKLAWGPVLDAAWARRIGAGRIAALGSVLVAAALATMATLDPPRAHVGALAWTWLLLNVALSLQDVAADAFAFDRVPAAARGRAVAVMLAGHHLGAEALAGAWVGALVAARGLSAGLAVLAGAAALVAAVVAIVGAPRGEAMPRSSGSVREAVQLLVLSPGGAVVIGFAALVFAADVVTAAVSGQWFLELGWTPEAVVERVVVVLLVGNLAGYASAAWLVDRIGHARVLLGSGLALGAVWIGFAACRGLWSHVGFVQGFIVVQAWITAWLYAATHAVLMDATGSRIRATQFAVLTACLNLPRLWAPALGASAVAALGFAGTFAACGVWQAALAVVAASLGLGRVSGQARGH
jgi:PAT family beta-lactamase induction signal transducer AmpG